jgi:hypothetical protein
VKLSCLICGLLWHRFEESVDHVSYPSYHMSYGLLTFSRSFVASTDYNK